MSSLSARSGPRYNPAMTPSEDRRETSAKRFGIQGWAVDSTIHISHIHVIESLDDGFAGRTGTRLFHELDTLCRGSQVKPELHAPHDRAGLFDLLDRITQDAKQGRYPLLHFETHGIAVQNAEATSLGIVLASGEGVTWPELAPHFTAINEATRLHLLVFMAACYGADLATLIHPLGRAPVRFIVGPMVKLSGGVIEKATHAFYRTLIRDGDGNGAFVAMSAALDPADPGFWKFPAETLFVEILKAYYNEPTTYDLIAARADADIAPLASPGVPAEALARARERRRLEIHNEIFDQCYHRFFFVDEYPDIAERFILTFERCFAEGTGA